MEVDPSALSLNLILGVLFVDIVLSGDNAIVIALACRSLSKKHRFKAMWLGVVGAFFARLLLSVFTSLVMVIPLIKLIGGFLLLQISISLIINNADNQPREVDAPLAISDDILSAAKTIVLADVVMSLDNVLALTAITQNNFQMLMIGLLISIPILMFGSIYLSRLLDMHPKLLWVGGAVLGAVAGSLIIDDPVFGSMFVNSSSVAPSIVPFLAGLYTLLQSKIILSNRRRFLMGAAPYSLWVVFNSKIKDKATRVYSAAVLARTDVDSDSQVAQVIEAVARSSKTPPHSSTVDSPPISTFVKKYRLGAICLISIGLIFGVIQLVMRGSLMPTPEGYITFQCTSPDMVVNYRQNAPRIRFVTKNGTISTDVLQGRIIWSDYGLAGLALGTPPPTRVVSMTSSEIVVNGGLFENNACAATQVNAPLN